MGSFIDYFTEVYRSQYHESSYHLHYWLNGGSLIRRSDISEQNNTKYFSPRFLTDERIVNENKYEIVKYINDSEKSPDPVLVLC